MRIFIVLAAVYVVLVIYGGIAAAQDAEDPIAVQVSHWEIQGLEGTQKVSQNPENCVMSADYDNDLRVTFKATGKRLTALRLESLSPTQNINNFRGFIGLGVGKNSYALQSQIENNQLDASLLNVPNLAEKMQDATVFRLKLGTQNTYFALQSFGVAYNNLLVCMGVMPTKTFKVVDHAIGLPRPPVEAPKVNMPATPVEKVEAASLDGEMLNDMTVEEIEAAVEGLANKVDAPQSLLPQDDETRAETEEPADDKKDNVVDANVDLDSPEWRGFKGDRLSAVLKKWASQKGVKTHIALDNDPILAKDVVSTGSFEVAVNTLLEQAGLSNGASALVKNKDGRVTHVAGKRSAVLQSQSRQAMYGQTIDRWRALQGSDLRKVLMQWTAKQNVDFVWNAPETYLVRQSLKTTNKFEEALALLLNQYKGEPTRPVAQLNKDPQTGRMSLVVNTHRDRPKTASLDR